MAGLDKFKQSLTDLETCVVNLKQSPLCHKLFRRTVFTKPDSNDCAKPSSSTRKYFFKFGQKSEILLNA